METISKEEIVTNVIGKIAPIVKQEKATKKHIFENFAVLTTIITIGAYVVLYAYKVSFLKGFNIPAICVRVNLKEYIPMLFQACSISIYIIWYFVFVKRDNALDQVKISVFRIMYGFLIISKILDSNNVSYFLARWSRLAIAVGVSFLIEMLLFFIKKKRKQINNQTIAAVEKDITLKNTIENYFFYRYYIKMGFFIIALSISVASFWGGLVAKSNNDFQLFRQNDSIYVVIADYDDNVIAQKANTDNAILTVDTSKYIFISKEGLEFEFKSFDQVTRTKDISGEDINPLKKNKIVSESE